MDSLNENTLWLLMDSLAARSQMEQGAWSASKLSELIKIASDLDANQLETLIHTARGLKPKIKTKNGILHSTKKIHS